MTALASLPGVSAVASLASAVLLIAAILAVAPPTRRAGRATGIAAASAVVAGALAVLALAGTLDATRTASAAAVAAAGGAAIALLLVRGVGVVARSVTAALGAALVVAPVAVVQLVAVPPLLETTLGAVDLGGALPRLAAPAGVLLGVLLVLRESAECPPHGPRLPMTRTLASCTLGASSVLAAVVAAEGRLDEVTVSILVFVVIGAVAGPVGWMLVVRIAGRPAHPADPVAGAVVGAAAVALAAVALVPVAVAAAGLAAGVVGGAVRGARRPLRGVALGILAGLSAGGVVVALLAEGIGFAATGSLGQAVAQVGAVLVITLGGALVGAALGGVARATTRRESARGNDNSPGEPGL